MASLYQPCSKEIQKGFFHYLTSALCTLVSVAVGKMISHTIAQCGVGFPYLAPCAYWYIVTDDISKAVGYATIEDVRDIQVVEAITKVIVIIIEFFHSKVNVTLPFRIQT